MTPPAVIESAGVTAKPQTAAEAILTCVPGERGEGGGRGTRAADRRLQHSVRRRAGARRARPKRQPVLVFCEGLAEVMFKVTRIVMYFAPIGVGRGDRVHRRAHGTRRARATSSSCSRRCTSPWSSSFCSCSCPIALIARVPLRRFAQAVARAGGRSPSRPRSSEAALPLAMQRMEQLGVPRPIVAFVMPTGYSFNLDGSTLYLALATVFVAQAAGDPPLVRAAARDRVHADAHEQRAWPACRARRS